MIRFLHYSQRIHQREREKHKPSGKSQWDLQSACLRGWQVLCCLACGLGLSSEEDIVGLLACVFSSRFIQKRILKQNLR